MNFQNKNYIPCSFDWHESVMNIRNQWMYLPFRKFHKNFQKYLQWPIQLIVRKSAQSEALLLFRREMNVEHFHSAAILPLLYIELKSDLNMSRPCSTRAWNNSRFSSSAPAVLLAVMCHFACTTSSVEIGMPLRCSLICTGHHVLSR